MLSHNNSFEQDDKGMKIRNVSQFKLVDIASKFYSMDVDNSSKVKYTDAMQMIQSVEHTRSLTALEQLLTWVIFCFRLFLSMSNVGKKMSGFKVGTRRVERGVIVG